MLRPFLLIGVGGSGGKTLRALRQALKLRLEQSGWGGPLPEGWQFLHIDTPQAQDGREFPAPLIPQENYLSLVPPGVSYATVHESIMRRVPTYIVNDVRRMLPSVAEMTPPINLRRSPDRAVGRAISVATLGDIYDKAKSIVSILTSAGAHDELKELTRTLGQPVVEGLNPTVILVSSLTGESGSGMFMDVAEATKAAIGRTPWAEKMFSFLYAPDVFGELGEARMRFMAPNALGAVNELVSGFWRSAPTDATLALYHRAGFTVPTDALYNLGPNLNYIVGRRNENAGLFDFAGQNGVFRATAEMLTSWMTHTTVQDYLLAYTVTRYRQTGAGIADSTGLKRARLDGQPLSSMGFSRVSLGLEKFSEYAEERIAKEALEALLTRHISEDPELRQMSEGQWVNHHADLHEADFIASSGVDLATNTPSELVALTKATLAQQGLPVTIELLSRLINHCRRELSSSPQVSGRTTDAKAEFLGSFVNNLIEPLQLQLSRNYGALRASVSDAWLPDATPNPFANWPNFKSNSVDRRFYPAPNEEMLLDPKTFPLLFDALIKQTLGDSHPDASRVVTEGVLSEAGLGSTVETGQPSDLVFESNHLKYLELAKRWCRRPNTPIADYLGQSLVTYLAAGGDEFEQSARRTQFVKSVTAALEKSAPMVTINQGLVELTHGSVGQATMCSGIPVDDTDPAYEAITNALIAQGHEAHRTRQWFIPSAAGAHLKSIEIFTQLESSVNPLVMSSLMQPIAASWREASSDYASRSNFMNWRRGRGLTEAIPAHQERWSLMLSGWHVARLLNLFENDTKHPSYADKGPKVSIWVDPSKQWRGFPYPLYSSQIARNVDDYPAVILESLIIALGECNLQQSLAPLDPYHKLMELGGGNSNQWSDLENWILNGSVPQGAPMPRAERAGLPTDSPQQRKEVGSAFFAEMMSQFRDHMASLDPQGDPKTYPLVWEIRKELDASFEAVLAAIQSIEFSDDL